MDLPDNLRYPLSLLHNITYVHIVNASSLQFLLKVYLFRTCENELHLTIFKKSPKYYKHWKLKKIVTYVIAITSAMIMYIKCKR